MTGAELLVKCLEKEGVEKIFGYPGVAICPFFDAMSDSELDLVLVRQEQNAAHAASGYARTKHTTGVVAVTSGPGATNLITGIATAFADSIPLVCITGQVDSRLMGSDVFQEADISGACESFVKYSYIVRDPKDIPRIVREAFYIAGSGRRGPVLIDVPWDVQESDGGKFSYPKEVSMRTYKPTVKGNGAQIKRVISGLEKAKRPILCVGGGVHLSGAREELRAFAAKYRMPVVSTMMGIGVMAADDPWYYGMVGNNGHPTGNKAMNEADLIMMVGARVADRSVSQPDLIMTGKVLIHIDVDPAEIGKIAGPNTPLVGDIRTIIRELDKHEISTGSESWIRHLDAMRRDDTAAAEAKLKLRRKELPEGCVDPETVIRLLSDYMSKDAVLTVDVGQNQIWACRYYRVKDGSFLTSGGMGTMGYAVPAAMGAKLAFPKKEVVAVCGDAAFQMSMMELGTMHQYGVPAKVVIFKNNTLGMVYQYQKIHFNKRYFGTNIDDTPEFPAIAKAYEMNYYQLNEEKKAGETVRAFLEDKNSAILVVGTDPEAMA